VLLRKLGSFRSWGGSLGRRVRSLRNRLSREGRGPGFEGVDGVVGDCGGALRDSGCKHSSSNSTFGTGTVVNEIWRSRFIYTHMLVGLGYKLPTEIRTRKT
jgi:hypothetical protein